MPEIAYLSLGSNIGDRAAHLRDALRRLAILGTVTSVSSFYETEPVDFAAQPWFLNCAAIIPTNLEPEDLLAKILAIERALGRRRDTFTRKGPRIIDIDILLLGHRVLHSPSLTIPHPALTSRRFVLEPLAEISPDAEHPVLNKTIRQLLGELPPSGQTVRRIQNRIKEQ